MSIERSTEYVRLRNMLLATLGSIIALYVVRSLTVDRYLRPISLTSESATTSGTASSKPTKFDYRPAVKSQGVLKPKLERSRLNNYQLMDMNDQGDKLFLASPQDAPYREYFAVINGQRKTFPRENISVRYSLAENGNIIRRSVPNRFMFGRFSRMMGGNSAGPFNELKFYRSLMDDGSILNIKYDSSKRGHKYSLVRTWMRPDREEIVYESANAISVQDRADDGSIWISEATKKGAFDSDILVRIKGNERQIYPYPSIYGTVARVSVTKGIIAATFGRYHDKEPTRSYVLEGKTWRELPIPDGYGHAFVQKVFKDGSILGIASDSEREKAVPILWKDHAVIELDKLANWPKQGLYSYVAFATRNGDLFVRDVNDNAISLNEFYLLSIRS